MSKSSGTLRAKLVGAIPKDFRPWVKHALAEGWTIEQRGGHVKLRTEGHTIPVPSCPNNRLRIVFRNQLRDAGLDPSIIR